VQVAKSAPFLILTAATWNLMGGGIDNGSDVRLRRQLTLLADLDLDVAAFQGCKRRADDDSALLHLAEEQLGMTGFLAKLCPPRMPPGRIRRGSR
jgi:hypothetical protein